MRVLLCIILACCTAPAFAEEESGFHFGASLAANNYQVSDPDGPTSAASAPAFGLIALYNSGRNSRLLLNIERDAYTLKASSSTMGQDVTTTSGIISWQSMFRMTRTFKPWFGAGLGVASSTYRNRHQLTPSGMFSVPYADRESRDFVFRLSANSEWELNRDFLIGLGGRYQRGLGNANSSAGVSLYLLY